MASRDLALRSDAFAGPAAVERGLVEMCRRGDAEAFARLVSLHESMVYNLSARLLGDGEEAKDLSQDVFLQVYRTLARFEGRSSSRRGSIASWSTRRATASGGGGAGGASAPAR